MKIVEDILKGILLISVIAVGVLFFYQKSVLRDSGVERGEVVVEEKQLKKNGEVPREIEHVRDNNVEYTSLYELRGLVLEEPDLLAIEEELPKVSGSLNIKGSFTDTYLLDTYAVTVRVAHVESGLGNFKHHNFRTSAKGGFNENVPLDSGPGEYKITILVPQTQHSYDDIGIAEVVSFYVNNGIEGWQTYRNEEHGFEFKYPVGWNIGEDSEKGLPSLRNYDPDAVASMDKEQQRFKIEIVKLPNENNLSLDDWVEQLVASSPSSPVVVDTEEVDIAGLRGVYQLEKVQDFTHPVIYVEKGGHVYLINASRNYDKFEYVLDELINSFEFTE